MSELFSFTTSENSVQCSILRYLLDLLAEDRNPTVRCATMCILVDIFKADTSEKSIKNCLELGLISVLREAISLQLKLDKCDLMTIMHLKCVVKIIWQISLLHNVVLKECFSSSFLEDLWVCLQSNGPFFGYSLAFSNKLEEICKKKYIAGKCKPLKMTAAISEELKKYNFFENYHELPKRLYECKLIDSSEGKEMNISDYLIELNLAWPSDEMSDFDSETSRDIFITEVIAGCYFWAQVGQATVSKSQKISSIISSYRSNLRKSLCKTGELVVVVTNTDGLEVCYRARVISYNHGQVKVFAFDFGFTDFAHENDVFALPVVVGMLEFPVLASLCVLSGVKPSPVDSYLVSTVAAAICNLIRFSYANCLTLITLGAPDNMLPLLKYPNPTIIIQILRIINNITRSSAHKKSMSLKTLVTVLDLCKTVISDDKLPSKMNCWIVEGCLACIANLLKLNCQYRDEFQNKQGLDIVLKAVSQTDRFSKIYKLSVQVLRNFVSTAGVHISLQDTAVTDRYSLHTGETMNDATRSNTAISPVAYGYEDHDDGGDIVDDDDVDDEISGKDCRVADTLDVTSSSIVPVNISSLCEAPAAYYEYETEVLFSDDATHELRPNRHLSEITADSVLKIVCSMLNSGRNCTIYFGVGKDQKVYGMLLTRENRDEFRLGVDRLMTRLTPPVLYFQYELVYVPVVKITGEEKSRRITPIENLFIAEIRLNSSSSTLYAIASTEQCFYRFGSDTSLLSCQEVRHLAVFAMEEIYKEEILALRKELSSL